MNARQFQKLTRAEQTLVYFSHELNLTTNRNGSRGPSMRAQSAYVNNWFKAFSDFADLLRP